MKVKELIEVLQSCNPDLNVCVFEPSTSIYRPIADARQLINTVLIIQSFENP